MGEHSPQDATARVLPKLCGADIELGNFIVGTGRAGSTGHEASRALLAEIKGLPIRQKQLPWTAVGHRLPRPLARMSRSLREPVPLLPTGVMTRRT